MKDPLATDRDGLMAASRWSRTKAISNGADVATWPEVKPDCLPISQQESYRQRKTAVLLYIKGTPTEIIEAQTGIKRRRISGLLRRCLAVAPDGRPYGFRALIPFLRTTAYNRIAPERAKFPQARGGKAGLLQQLFKRFPNLEEDIKGLVLKERRRGVLHEFRISAVRLHGIFLQRIEDLGVTKTEWPFTTIHLGSRTIQRYMKTVLDQNFSRAVNARGESDAKAHLATGGGQKSLIHFEVPFSAVELDAHSIQAFFSVAFNTPEGTQQYIQLDRLWLLALIERGSSAVLTYIVVYSSEVNADDVLRLLRKAVADTWKPMELTIPGLVYPSGCGLPSGVIPVYQGAVWSTLMLDGALSNLALKVRELARKNIGFSVNWGPVGHFERRPNIERLFKNIEDRLFKRLPSTTGSKPGSGRAPDAEGAATRYKIDAFEMEQLLDVTIAQYNGTESEGLSYMSPLDYLRYFSEEQGDHFMIRRLPEFRRTLTDPIPTRDVRKVRGGSRSGRKPYIQLDREHYTNALLKDSAHLVGKELLLEINEEDYRFVRAYLSSGEEIGILMVEGQWGISKHSRTTRKAIKRLIARGELDVRRFDDPVQIYMRHLATPKQKTKKLGKLLSPSAATESVRVSKESGIDLVIHAPPIKKYEPKRPRASESAIGRPLPDLQALLNRRK